MIVIHERMNAAGGMAQKQITESRRALKPHLYALNRALTFTKGDGGIGQGSAREPHWVS